MKILTILGARFQFIKAGAVSKAIKRVKEIIVHTDQHYDKNMSDVFFEELHISKTDYFLGVGGKSHGSMTGEMIIKLEEIMLKEKPDVVLVYGNTNSTLAGAVTASKLHIPIAHINIPSAVHIDGNARVQFVSKEDNEGYYNLIEEVKNLTGYGVIINTSFNKHGRTIVESPQDAITDFLDTDMDYLFIEGFLVERL